MTNLPALLLLLCRLSLLSAKCSSGQWQCKDTSCILREKVCNGRSDCEDRSDEAEVCQSGAGSCPPFLFSCDSGGECLSQVSVCNGRQECSDNSDERQPQCHQDTSPAPGPSRDSSASTITLSQFIIILIALGVLQNHLCSHV